MPIYEYQCQACGDRSEVMQRMSADPLTTCEKCGGDLKKLISAPAFQFKGSGWYVTDYARQGKDKDGSSKDSKAPSDVKSGGDSDSTSSKSESPTTKSDSASAKSDSKSSTKSTTKGKSA